jgi:hypothetical protein
VAPTCIPRDCGSCDEFANFPEIRHRRADNAGGLNAVVMAGSEALLFLWRG